MYSAVTSYEPEVLSGHNLEGISFLKKIEKVFRPVGAAVAGATGGLIGLKPKVFNVRSRMGKKVYRISRTVAAVAAVSYGAYTIAPWVLSKLSKKATEVKASKPGEVKEATTKGGMLQWVGGKLKKIPAGVAEILTSQGIDPSQATPEEALIAGEQVQAGILGIPTPMLIGGVAVLGAVAVIAGGKTRVPQVTPQVKKKG